MRCSLRSRTGAMTATRTKFRALLATTAATGLALTGFVFAAASPASAGSDPCASPMYRAVLDDQGFSTGNNDKIAFFANDTPEYPNVTSKVMWNPNAQTVMICRADGVDKNGTTYVDTNPKGNRHTADAATGIRSLTVTATDIPATQPDPSPTTPAPMTPAPTSTPPTASPNPTATPSPTASASRFAVAKVAADSTSVRRSGHIGVTSRNLRPGRAVKVFEERVAGGKTVSTKKGQATVNKYGTTRFSFVPDNVLGKAKIVVIGADTAGKPVKVTFAITVK